jgi:hypothetical protein
LERGTGENRQKKENGKEGKGEKEGTKEKL